MKILAIIGAKPQFIKVAAVSRREQNKQYPGDHCAYGSALRR